MQCKRCGGEEFAVIRTTRETDHDQREIQCKTCKRAFLTEERISAEYHYDTQHLKAVLKPMKVWPECTSCKTGKN